MHVFTYVRTWLYNVYTLYVYTSSFTPSIQEYKQIKYVSLLVKTYLDKLEFCQEAPAQGKFLQKINNWIQGRIQDLSEGGARFISEQKNTDLETKRRVTGEICL